MGRNQTQAGRVNGWTVRELAARWNVPENVAQQWLEGFANAGLADEEDGHWSASRLARLMFLGHGEGG